MQASNAHLEDKKHQKLIEYIQELNKLQKKRLKIEPNFRDYERGWVPYWDNLYKFLVLLERGAIHVKKEKIKFVSCVNNSDYDERWDEYIEVKEFILRFKGDFFKISFRECSHGMHSIKEFKVVEKRVKSIEAYE